MTRARALAAESSATAGETDRGGRFPAEVYAAAAAAGLTGIAVPAAYGGIQLSTRGQAAVIEALAHGCAAVVGAVIGNGIQAAQTLLHGDSDAARERLLPALVRGERQIAFAITEECAGSDAAALRCRAVNVDGGWRLTGDKVLINRASLSSSAVVFATVDPALRHRGVTAFLVNLVQPGIGIGKPINKTGQRGLPTESIHLQEAFVPACDRLSEVGKGFGLMMKVINRARVMVAANAVGRMSAALEFTVGHIQQREQFGTPLAKLDGVKVEITEMAVQVATGRCLTQAAAALLDEGGTEQVMYCAMAKLHTTEACIEVCRRAMLLCGGYGYTDVLPVERMLRDALAGQIVDGANPVQRQIVAGELFKHYATH